MKQDKMQAKVKKVMRGYKSRTANSSKGEKVSSQFVKEMEKAYPKRRYSNSNEKRILI